MGLKTVTNRPKQVQNSDIAAEIKTNCPCSVNRNLNMLVFPTSTLFRQAGYSQLIDSKGSRREFCRTINNATEKLRPSESLRI